jgi:hypothetical protein
MTHRCGLSLHALAVALNGHIATPLEEMIAGAIEAVTAGGYALQNQRSCERAASGERAAYE